MSKFINRKNLLIASFVLLIVGFIIFGIGYFSGNGLLGVTWDGSRFEYMYSDNQSQVIPLQDLAAFEDIYLDVNSRNVKFVESDKFAIESTGKSGLTFDVNNNKLTVKEPNNFSDKKIRLYIMNFNFNGMADNLTIYYPKGTAFSNISLSVSSGSLNISGIKAKTLNTNVDFGRSNISGIDVEDFKGQNSSGSIKLSDSSFKTIYIENDFGKIDLNNLVATGPTYLSSNSASLNISSLTSESLEVDIDFGSANISNTSVKGFTFEGDSSSLKYQGSIQGNSKISNDFGSVKLKLDGNVDDYFIHESVDFGNISLPSSYDYNKAKNAPYNIDISTSSGSVSIDID